MSEQCALLEEEGVGALLETNCDSKASPENRGASHG